MALRLVRTALTLTASALLATMIALGLVATSSASAGPMVPATNLQRANGGAPFARALLRDAPLPRGARIVVNPRGLGDAVGRPSMTDLVDVRATYQVRLPFNLGTFLRSRRPSGAVLSGQNSASGSNIESVTGYSYSLPFANRHVSYEQLDYSVNGPHHGVEDLRVDAEAVWLPIESVTMPTSKPVTLTAYDHLSLAMGPSGAVSITLSSSQAGRLAHVVASLSTAGGGACMESSPLFVITTATRATKGAASKFWTATAQECPSSLDVVIGTRHFTLDDSSCALRALVASDLPRGEAAATRQALTGCIE